MEVRVIKKVLKNFLTTLSDSCSMIEIGGDEARNLDEVYSVGQMTGAGSDMVTVALEKGKAVISVDLSFNPVDGHSRYSSPGERSKDAPIIYDSGESKNLIPEK
jgi:hypothetical protein